MRRGALLALLLLLAACGTSRTLPGPAPAGQAGGWSCVPYARARTGIELRGDAWQWWEAAAGRYDRLSPALVTALTAAAVALAALTLVLVVAD